MSIGCTTGTIAGGGGQTSFQNYRIRTSVSVCRCYVFVCLFVASFVLISLPPLTLFLSPRTLLFSPLIVPLCHPPRTCFPPLIPPLTVSHQCYALCIPQ